MWFSNLASHFSQAYLVLINIANDGDVEIYLLLLDCENINLQ